MKHGLRKIASAILLVITLTACSQGAATPTAAPVDTGATQVVALPTVAPSDPCANEYFPVKNNATYTYSSTGSPSGPYTFTRTITNARPDGFTLTSQFKNLELNQDWSCKPEGLVANQLGATDATSMLAFEKFTDLQGSNITGVVLPPGMAPGAEWIYSLDIQGVEKVKEGTPATMTGHTAIAYTVGNKESVTVPAGTFEAIAIEVSTVIDFNVVTPAKTIKLSIDSSYTLWYAPGVGWVKSSGNGKLGGQEYFETIVLESYSIP
jgi:hypothetical protein